MKRFSAVQKLMMAIATFVLLTILTFTGYIRTGAGVFLSFSITFFTISYHFIMRVLVGEVVTLVYKNREFRYDSFWLRERPFEKKLYAFLKVKRWKLKMITAKPEQFDVHERSLAELLHNMAQAEIVHEIIMILSFVPVLWIPFFGEPFVFVLTSVAACIADSIFVIMQRYNRPRVLKMQERKQHV